MAFENFYDKESSYDEITRQWWVVILFVGVAFTAILLLPSEPEVVPTEVSYGERLRRLERACDRIPKPEKFYFTQKASGKDQDGVWTNNFYETERSSEEVFPLFINWLETDGWNASQEQYSELAFIKNDQGVIVNEVPQKGPPQAKHQYLIRCKERTGRKNKFISPPNS